MRGIFSVRESLGSISHHTVLIKQQLSAYGTCIYDLSHNMFLPRLLGWHCATRAVTLPSDSTIDLRKLEACSKDLPHTYTYCMPSANVLQATET